MVIVFVGVDLAKRACSVGVSDAGRAELSHPAVPRGKLLEFGHWVATVTLRMERCDGAHSVRSEPQAISGRDLVAWASLEHNTFDLVARVALTWSAAPN